MKICYLSLIIYINLTKSLFIAIFLNIERVHMLDKNEVVKELAVRNKEIYLNKLNMDIDSHYELLKLITTNIIDLSINEVISNILNIENSFLNKKRIEFLLNEYFQDYFEYIDSLYKKRIIGLKMRKDKDNYLDYINNKIIDDIKEYYVNNFVLIIEDISIDYSDLKKERLNNYINNIFYNKFIFKLLDSIDNANTLLINNYYESRDRYNLINEKTLK